MKITATELNKRPGTYLSAAIKSPVIVEKTGKPSVVMVPYERYLELEDFYWGEQAIEADKAPALSSEETLRFLKDSS